MPHIAQMPLAYAQPWQYLASYRVAAQDTPVKMVERLRLQVAAVLEHGGTSLARHGQQWVGPQLQGAAALCSTWCKLLLQVRHLLLVGTHLQHKENAC